MEPRSPATPSSAWLALTGINLLMLVFGVQGLHSGDSDTFYHLAGGRWMFEHRAVLDREVFSFTIPDRPWLNYYWLFEALLYGLHRLGGYPAVIGLRAAVLVALSTSLFLLTWRLTHRRLGLTVTFTLLALGLVMPRSLNIRPHLFSYLFLAVTLLSLEWMRGGPRRFPWWLVPLCALWANLHGVEYPVALAVMAFAAADALRPVAREQVADLVRRWDIMRWVALPAACALALAANPFGLSVFEAPRIATRREVMSYIGEMAGIPWSGLFKLDPAASVFALSTIHIALLLALVALPAWWRARDLRALVTVPFALLMVHDKVRFVAEFGVIAVPFIASGWAALRPGHAALRFLTPLVFLYLTVGYAAPIGEQFHAGAYEMVDRYAYPLGAVRAIQQAKITGNLLCNPTYAGYISWILHPEVKTSMDMRTPEPFDAQTYWMVRSVGGSIPLEKFRERWPVDMMLLNRGSSMAAKLAAEEKPEYVFLYADPSYDLFVRRDRIENRPDLVPLKVMKPYEDPAENIKKLSKEERDLLERELASLLASWDENTLAHLWRNLLLLQSDRPQEALTLSLDLEKRFPREATYPYHTGLAHLDLEDTAGAIEDFERAVRITPHYLPPYPALADALYKRGEYDRGLRVMGRYLPRKAFDLNGKEYFLLGNLRYRRGTLEGAADAFERALWLVDEKDELRAWVENNLGGIYVDLGEPERALRLLETASGRVSPFPEADFNKARALAGLGRWDEARVLLEGLLAGEGVNEELQEKAKAELGRGPGGP
ncbi:MAG: tetratricopeptide repeat protein [Nitrospirae bacterium]|nr:tetratricopeptide repeat protein [Nitrospirota bacterium]